MVTLNSIRETSKLEWILLALMIAICLICRLSFAETWNVKPVAALLMFGAFFFRRSWLPIVGLMIGLLISDIILGLYHPLLMVSVYLSMILAGMMGVLLRRYRASCCRWAWWTRIFGASLAMSILFFLLTNGAHWLFLDTYPKTLTGLISCYAAGLPFFWRTLAGNLFFSMLAFGSYAVVYELPGQTNEKKELAWESAALIEQENH